MSDRCKSCQAPIRWAATSKGSRMPLDADPVADGNIILDEHRIAHVIAKDATVPPDVLRYVSHFTTCPNSAEHRRKKVRR